MTVEPLDAHLVVQRKVKSRGLPPAITLAVKTLKFHDSSKVLIIYVMNSELKPD